MSSTEGDPAITEAQAQAHGQAQGQAQGQGQTTPAPAATPAAPEQKPVTQAQPDPKQAVVDPGKTASPDPAEEQKPLGPLTGYAEYDDPSAKTVVHLLKEAKVDPNVAHAIFGAAIESGDMSKVDKDMLVANVGAERAALILANAQAAMSSAQAKVEAETKAVLSAVGGEENWKTLVGWAHKVEAADPKIKTKIDEIRELIDRGGNFALLGVQELQRMYNADPNNVGTGASGLMSGTAVAAPESNPLSRAEYLKEVKAAYAKGDMKAVAALRARRQAGRAAGI